MMDQATELLNSLSEDQISAYTASPETEEHIVVNADRTITVPAALKRIAVQYDHNVETVTFDCPRYWDEHDLSTMVVYIIYVAPNGTEPIPYVVENKHVDTDDPSVMHFSWRIGGEMTSVPGTITFLVCVKNTDENGTVTVHWNSEINADLYISPGMELGTFVEPESTSDMATLLLKRVDGIETGYDLAVKNGFEGTEEEWLASLKGEKGDTGATGPQGETGIGIKNITIKEIN